MHKVLLFLILFLSSGVMAEKVVAPDWMDGVSREALYPAGKYYTGFASATILNGEDKESVYTRVQQNARIAAVSSIQVTVEQTIERFMQNAQIHGEASSAGIMTSFAQTHTSIKDVPGLKMEVWENPKTHEVSAFAWVKISNLTNRLMRRIAANTAKLELELKNIDTLVSKGDKMQAKNDLSDLQTLLDDIENDQRIMLSVDPSVTDEDLSMEDTKRLKEHFLTLNTDLKNGLNIYLVCTADLFGEPYPALQEGLRGALSPLGITIVDTAEQSDWSIAVTASAREYNAATFGNVTNYSADVDAQIIINKTATSQRIYENRITVQGAHTHNYEQAARQAYKDLSPKISQIIQKQLKQ